MVAVTEVEAALAAAVAGIRLMAAIAGGMVVAPVEVQENIFRPTTESKEGHLALLTVEVSSYAGVIVLGGGVLTARG